ncbi:MAG: hypothetical protein AB7N80_10245 [Bdellovibrionales bacterium]
MILLGRAVFAIALLLIALDGQAVMQPDQVRRGLGLRNHLQAKTLDQHVKELQQALPRLQVRLLTPWPSPLSYGMGEEVDSQTAAKRQLDFMFEAAFSDLNPNLLALYRNIFLGDSGAWIEWGLPAPRQRHLRTDLFDLHYVNKSQFKIYLPVPFKGRSILEQTGKLVALMSLDLQTRLIEQFGGIGIYHVIFPKIQVMTQIYSAFLFWEVLRQIPPEAFARELDQVGLAHPNNPMWSNLHLMQDLLGRRDAATWIHLNLQPLYASEPDVREAVLTMAAEFIEQRLTDKTLLKWWSLSTIDSGHCDGILLN